MHAARRIDIDSTQLAARIARIADEKQADDVAVIDVDEQLGVADWFVVISGRNRTHVRALANELHVRLKELGERHRPPEGRDLGWWVVLDYGDVVVHVLQPDAREFYGLDRLFGECPRLDWAAVELPGDPGERAETA